MDLDTILIILGAVITLAVYSASLLFGYYTGVRQEKRLSNIEEPENPHIKRRTDPLNSGLALTPDDIDRINDWNQIKDDNK